MNIDQILRTLRDGLNTEIEKDIAEAKRSLEAEMVWLLPEIAIETRTLGKDYAGYSRGFNDCRDLMGAAIEESFNA